METTMSIDDGGALFCGVPETLATGMTWSWQNGRLEFRFRHAKDEQAKLLQLSDWLSESETNSLKLARWMQEYASAFDREAS
jgi:hypothetical protein